MKDGKDRFFHLRWIVCCLVWGTYSSLAGAEVRSSSLCNRNDLPIVESINHIGSEIVRNIEDNGNLLLSPLGLSIALGMVYLAANPITERQMGDVLGYKSAGIGNKTVHQNMQRLIKHLKESTNSPNQLDLTNGIFSQYGLSMNGILQRDIEVYYEAQNLVVNFLDPIRSTHTINNWVYDRTDKKVLDFLVRPLPADTTMLLVNALYFKGLWKIQFPKERTYNSSFYVNGDVDGIVSMMNLGQERFPYFEDHERGYKFLELPYKGDEISMIFALPLSFNQSPSLAMSPELLCHVRKNLKQTKLRRVDIPKFRMEVTKSLKESLTNMGLTHAFQPGATNFYDERDPIHISDILQKSVLEVNEEGSEVSTVTSVALIPLSARQVEEFVANRPFAFYIVHRSTGTMLFSGKLIKTAQLNHTGSRVSVPDRTRTRPTHRKRASTMPHIRSDWSTFSGLRRK